jgi:hypothetical protein
LAQTEEDPQGERSEHTVVAPSAGQMAAPPVEAAPVISNDASGAENIEDIVARPIDEVVVAEIDILQELSDEEFEAVAATANSFSESLQQLTAEAADYSKKSFDNGSVFLKSLFGARSLSTIVDVQTSYTETAYANYLAHLVKMSDLYRNLLEVAARPASAAKPR